MANHKTAVEIGDSGIFELQEHRSVQRPTPEQLAGVPQWPTVTQTVEDELGTHTQTVPARYATLVDGVYVAAPDGAVEAYLSAQAEAEQLAVLVAADARIGQLVQALGENLVLLGYAQPWTRSEIMADIIRRSKLGEIAIEDKSDTADLFFLLSEADDAIINAVWSYRSAQ